MTKESLQHSIKAMVWEKLNTWPKELNNKEDLYNHVSESFKIVKFDIQEAVAIAFEEAMTEFTHQDITYTCKITAMETRRE